MKGIFSSNGINEVENRNKKEQFNNRLLFIGGIIIFSSIVLSSVSAFSTEQRIEMINNENNNEFVAYFLTNLLWLNLFSWILYFVGIVVTSIASVKTLSLSIKTRNFKSGGTIASITFVTFLIGLLVYVVLSPNNPGLIMLPVEIPWIIKGEIHI